MGVTSANIPNFSGKASLSLADLQALADVVRANMLHAEAPPPPVRVGVALPRPAHHVPAGGMYFGESFIAPVPSHVSRPGLVKSLDFMSGLSRPAFVQGKGYIPLAESVDAAGNFLPTPVAGAIAGVQWAEDSSVSAPRILPGGVLEIPPSSGGGGMEPPLAEWDAENYSVPGLMAAVYFTSAVERPKISYGHMYIPTAATVNASSVDLPSAVAGAIAGVQWAADSSVSAPRILPGGLIELPRPTGGGVELRGLVAAGGSQVEWNDVEAMPGAQVKVASILLNTGSGSLPFSLYAGFNDGFLSFSLADSL